MSFLVLYPIRMLLSSDLDSFAVYHIHFSLVGHLTISSRTMTRKNFVCFDCTNPETDLLRGVKVGFWIEHERYILLVPDSKLNILSSITLTTM